MLGLALKGGTDDIRESPAIAFGEWLLNGGAMLQTYAPAAMDGAQSALPSGSILFVRSAYDAADGTTLCWC